MLKCLVQHLYDALPQQSGLLVLWGNTVQNLDGILQNEPGIAGNDGLRREINLGRRLLMSIYTDLERIKEFDEERVPRYLPM